MISVRLIRLPLLLAALFFLVACSSKQYYEPSVEPKPFTAKKAAPSTLLRTFSDGAMLENGDLLLRDQLLVDFDANLTADSRFVNYAYPYVIFSDVNGTMTLYNTITQERRHLSLGKTIAAASIKGDRMAIVFANNELALYNLKKESIYYKQGATPVTIVDTRIQKPYFLNDLVLFFTLDGKIVIVNEPKKQELRSIIVSSNDYYNNVIFFGIHDDKMVAATHYKLFSITQKEKRAAYDIRDIVYRPGEIWITTREGELIALTPELSIKNRIKFPFAHFYAMHVDDSHVFLLESQGYMIVLDKVHFTYDVYEVDVDEAPTFATNEGFYNSDEIIEYAK